MTDTLSHLINGEAVGGDATGESINPSDLDDVVARYPKGGAAEVDDGGKGRARRIPRLVRQPRPKSAPTCSTRPAR